MFYIAATKYYFRRTFIVLILNVNALITHNTLLTRLSNALLLVWSVLLLCSLPVLINPTAVAQKQALAQQTQANEQDQDDSTTDLPRQSIQAPVQVAISPIGQLPVFYPAAFAPTEAPEVAEEERVTFEIPPLYGKLARLLFRILISPNAP